MFSLCISYVDPMFICLSHVYPMFILCICLFDRAVLKHLNHQQNHLYNLSQSIQRPKGEEICMAPTQSVVMFWSLSKGSCHWWVEMIFRFESGSCFKFCLSGWYSATWYDRERMPVLFGHVRKHQALKRDIIYMTRRCGGMQGDWQSHSPPWGWGWRVPKSSKSERTGKESVQAVRNHSKIQSPF